MNITDNWRTTLAQVLDYYQTNRPGFWKFFPRLFLFFIFVNVFCYWWASITAFPDSLRYASFYYFKMQFPVGILGALFDSLSFFVTIFLIRRALESKSNWRFVGHLSVDIIIAILATFWVLFVFSFSSYLIRLTEVNPEMSAALIERQAVYIERFENAINSPGSNKRNIYFGIIMGISAILPTCFHFYLAFRSSLKKVPSFLLQSEKFLSKFARRRFMELK